MLKAEGASGRLGPAQADVGVAMQTGAQAAREAGNMVDLDSDPTKLIDVVQVGNDFLADFARATARQVR